jgi:protein-S-isoprenylcysteine O-methyltransferase Ste14
MGPVDIVALIWGVSEVLLVGVRRARGAASVGFDRASFAVVWGGIILGLTAARWLAHFPDGWLAGDFQLYQWAGAGLMLVGMGIRALAVYTLGRFFTVNVSVAKDHQVVQTGLYRFVRHPSYTGALLTFLGYGLALRSWWSLIALAVPVAVAFAYRIRVEEAALTAGLGAQYSDYAARTKRLIPFVY